MTLAARAWLSLVALAIVMGAILLVPAGTINYWQAWLYLVVFISASAFTTGDLAKRDPALLERRLRGGPTAEQESTQRVIMVLASLCFGSSPDRVGKIGRNEIETEALAG